VSGVDSGLIRLGLPKGRLTATTERVLHALGPLNRSRSTYRIIAGDLAIWLLKVRDIPALVAAGALDLGIAPDEWIEECGEGTDRLASLDGYRTRISLLVPRQRSVRLDCAERLRVATEFPNLTRRHLAGRVANLEVIEVHGSCEAYPLELADVVVDCVETGETARRHGLEECEPVLECGLHLIVNASARDSRARRELAARIVSAVNGRGRVAAAGAGGHAPPTTTLRLYDLAPHLRAALLPVVRRDEEEHPIGGGRAARLLHPRGSTPAYLALWDRELRVSASGVSSVPEMAESLEAYIAAGGLREHSPDIFYLVALLSIWDDVIREVGLYPGRVYLASEEAARRLFPVAGLDLLSPDQFATLLLEAQALELVYRFPVAYKFRSSYGGENQCRLNGWGRRLAQRAVRDPGSAALRERLRAPLRRHLLEHRDVYSSHIEHVSSGGLTTAPADSWSLANELPVPILL
jgi:ATP phosphoribosyltransferase